MAASCPYSDIKISPQEIHFEVEEGAQFIPPYQYITVEKVGHDLTPRWRAWLLYSASSSYFTFTPESGTAPDRVRVGIRKEALKLEPGKLYGDDLRFENTSGSAILPSPLVTISFKIKPKTEPPPPPVYSDVVISPGSLEFEAEEGSSPYPQKLSVTRMAAHQPPHWTASPDSPWLNVYPADGLVPSEILVTPDTTQLTPDTYQVFVSFGSPEQVNFFPSAVVPITVVIKPKEEPPPPPPPPPQKCWLCQFFKNLVRRK